MQGGRWRDTPSTISGEHARIIARDGRMLESAPGAGADLATEVLSLRRFPARPVMPFLNGRVRV
ncbi:MAG: hypothetical protein R3E95_05515 [Thiolinea sp.]